MSDNLSGFIITWKIENFSYSWHKYDKAIKCPEFRAYILQSTEWRLSVFPRGKTQRDYIACLLERNTNGPKEIKLNVEISFLGPDGSALAQQVLNCETFHRNGSRSFYSFVKRDEVFADKRAEFLHEDILTLRCRLWTNDMNSFNTEKRLARTRIEVVRNFISGAVDGFSSIPTDEVRSVRITSASEEIKEYRMNLQLIDGMNCDENLVLEIIFPKNQPRKFSICKVYLLDAVESKLECGKSAINFEQEQDWKFVLFPTKRKLNAKKSLYLSNDIISLECEIIISTGISFVETGDRISPELNPISDGISPELNPVSDANRFGDPSTSSSALKDLYNLYRDQVLCDVTLETDTEAFLAHTVILSARSSVFRAMFTSDMKEKRNACVNISDFDSETVRHLLLYVYTDTVGDLKWDIAFQLYVAADKYAIISLKEKCSSFLKDSLSTSKAYELSKACELLVLSDTHQDIDLKNFTQNFICQNDEVIFSSREWKDLGQKNPQLIIETLSKMHTNMRALLNVYQSIK